MRLLAPAGVVSASVGVGAASTAVAAGGNELGAAGAAGVVPVESSPTPVACRDRLSGLSRLPSSEHETPDLRAAPCRNSMIGHPPSLPQRHCHCH